MISRASTGYGKAELDKLRKEQALFQQEFDRKQTILVGKMNYLSSVVQDSELRKQKLLENKKRNEERMLAGIFAVLFLLSAFVLFNALSMFLHSM